MIKYLLLWRLCHLPSLQVVLLMSTHLEAGEAGLLNMYSSYSIIAPSPDPHLTDASAVTEKPAFCLKGNTFLMR